MKRAHPFDTGSIQLRTHGSIARVRAQGLCIMTTTTTRSKWELWKIKQSEKQNHLKCVKPSIQAKGSKNSAQTRVSNSHPPSVPGKELPGRDGPTTCVHCEKRNWRFEYKLKINMFEKQRTHKATETRHLGSKIHAATAQSTNAAETNSEARRRSCRERVRN